MTADLYSFLCYGGAILYFNKREADKVSMVVRVLSTVSVLVTYFFNADNVKDRCKIIHENC